MKKKALKIIAAVAAIIILLSILWLASAFLGNPISKYIAANTAEKYIEKNFPETNYYVERVGYNFKDGAYYAHIKLPESVDSDFSLCITMTGKLKYDDYKSRVQDKGNTANRLNQAYMELVDTVLNSPTFPYVCSIGYGTLEIYSRKYIESPGNDDIPGYAIVQDDLVLDKVYDISELGRQAGHLILYIENGTVNIEQLSKILLDIKNRMDTAGVTFYTVDLVLEYPRSENDALYDENSVEVKDFLYSDIYEKGICERVKESNEAAREYYARMDSQK